ncbi:MAG: MmgE/PrpD family protein [Pirellulales bacterium]|nr:MmgE/PrpD family protein [Pirellulales bacterium]
MEKSYVCLARHENQARGLAAFCIDFLAGRLGEVGTRALQAVERFHLDSVACAVSALACGTNAPTVLRQEALEYPAVGRSGAVCFGSRLRVMPEKAVLANCAAVREWDANGTNFGYDPLRGHTAGEFGHNDFYPVAVAGASVAASDGAKALRAMLLIDEIRGRLAEVFSLKEHKLDHVIHGAIASAAVYGALLGASVEQIESALGLLVAHYIPFRAIRAGHQLSDSKGASAAISAEMAVLSVHRALRGFQGPADVFRNPQAIFCLFGRPDRAGESPFDLVLTARGDDFAVCGMHFKLGLYEHQSAGAIQGLIDILQRHPAVLETPQDVLQLRITIYEPAFSIIADPAKRDPRTRQSADHSLPYIVATLLRKAFEQRQAGWAELMLLPADYEPASLFHPLTRELMQRIELCHGGPEYDTRYPDGIPTTVELQHRRLGWLSSGLILYPLGHARCTDQQLDRLLAEKFRRLAQLGVDEPRRLWERLQHLQQRSAEEVADLYTFPIRNLL